MGINVEHRNTMKSRHIMLGIASASLTCYAATHLYHTIISTHQHVANPTLALITDATLTLTLSPSSLFRLRERKPDLDKVRLFPHNSVLPHGQSRFLIFADTPTMLSLPQTSLQQMPYSENYQMAFAANYSSPRQRHKELVVAFPFTAKRMTQT